MSSPPDLRVRLPGMAPITMAHYPMPQDKARFVGEPIALVVAETTDDAKNASELIDIVYDELPAVVRASEALKPDAPSVWDEAPGNICIEIEAGDEAATDAAFARAAHVVRLETWAQRVTGVPMEPRTNIAEYDTATGNYTLHSSTGRVVPKLRLNLPQLLPVPPHQFPSVSHAMRCT